MNTSDLRSAVRNEMRQVLDEMSRRGPQPAVTNASIPSENRLWGDGMPSSGGPAPASARSPQRVGGIPSSAPEERIAMMTERITMLEDVLAKSEADRAAVYAKHTAAIEALNAANEEKMSMLHELHDGGRKDAAEFSELLQQSRNENAQLREQIKSMEGSHKEQVASYQKQIEDLEDAIQKLKRRRQAKEQEKLNGVSLADLHYSNERLSAQLAKLQSPAPAKEDEARIRSLEAEITSLQHEVELLESRMREMQLVHTQERNRLQETLDRQFHEFSVERMECDRVVGIMSAKLETVLQENNILRTQLHAAEDVPTPAVAANSSAAATPMNGSKAALNALNSTAAARGDGSNTTPLSRRISSMRVR